MRLVFLVIAALCGTLLYSTAESWSISYTSEKDTLTAYLKQALENLRLVMGDGVPDIGLPPLDPLSIPTIDERVKEGVADVQFKVTDLKVTGLRQFNIKAVKVDLSTMTANIRVFVPEVSASGQYNLDGKIAGILPLYGSGKCDFRVVDFDVGMKAELDLTSGKLQLKSADPQISLSTVGVYLENILGGGSLGEIVNFVVNALGTKLFNSNKGAIENALRGVILDAANKELRNLNLGSLGYHPYDEAQDHQAAQNAMVDNLLLTLRPMLLENDPMTLPDAYDGFEKKVGKLTFKGYAKLTSGSMRGLSSLHRTGNSKMYTDDAKGQTVIAVDVGVTMIDATYDGELYFLGLRLRPALNARIAKVSVFCEVRFDLETGAKSLTQFRINTIEKPKVKITNVSILGPIASFLTNLVISPVINGVRGTMETKIKAAMQDALAKSGI